MYGFPVEEVRGAFPGLTRKINGGRAIFFDGPGGSQVPQSVANAVGNYLLHHNANTGMSFATSRETDQLIEETMRACADFLGCENPREVVFGQNMTSLNIQLASALSRTWGEDDEVVVIRLDHDGNVQPWVLAAEWSGATLRKIDVNPDDCTLDPSSIVESINEKTTLVAVGAASNFSGTVNDVREIANRAHEFGAEVVVDAVHYAPHRLIDIKEMGCDYLLCSPYKFFGPHQGILWGRADRMAELPVAKLRVSTEGIPFRWMTGTQSYEGLAGTLAAIEHIAWVGRKVGREELPRREALSAAFKAIESHENELCWQIVEGLMDIEGVRIWGITDSNRSNERAPTVSFTHPSKTASEIADALAEQGIFVWAGNFYALELSEALDLGPEGALRIGVLHYNTTEEVERFLSVVRDILG